MIIAIDPGASGGVAGVHADGKVWSKKIPSTEGDLLKLLREKKTEGVTTAYLEDLVKYTGVNMPSSSMAVYASSWGVLKGMLMALGYSLILVKPKDWQKKLGLGSAAGLSKSEWKNKLKAEAQRVYPDQEVTLSTSDALLMLRAARLLTGWGHPGETPE